MTEQLIHYGTPRHSGRYPWGSGDTPQQNSHDLLGRVADLRRQGLSETQIAEGLGMNTTQLRAAKAIAKNEKRKADASQALRLKNKGMSNVAIGERMGLNESSVRALLDPVMQERTDMLVTISNMLKDQVDEKGFIDIGSGVESHLGISATKLKTAVAMLEQKGYAVHNVQTDQIGTGAGKKTTIRVLAPPDTKYVDIVRNPERIKTITSFSEDGGRTFLGIHQPISVDSKRVAVRYAEDGGRDADGVIYVRPGIDDVSLGKSRYAQVRIAVDGTHYLKGMAMYKDDLPNGIDLMFNTNKSDTGNKLDAMKKMKDDPDNPFGAIVRQRVVRDANGVERVTSAMNIVNEEGSWHSWSHTFSSQMLSKQSPTLAKQQLQLSYDIKKAEFDEIMSLTNPMVRKTLLDKFADGADSSAIHLKAAALPRSRNHVILPIPDLDENEVYAPNYRNGESVVLIRHPHGGIFEIPELTVNNRHEGAKKALGNAPDAIGIHPKVAQRLSGADFDGDSVLVIPNNSGAIKTSSPLKGLKGFDPQEAYPGYEGMKPMSARAKQMEMGNISNLITDMTIKGAPADEIARAVRHSMVVIDAEKHKLNYRQSSIDNGIKELKLKYQARLDGRPGGAATLISKSSSQERVPTRKLRSAVKGGSIDPATGKKVYEYTNETYVDKQGKTVTRTIKSTKMAETDNAHSLSSGTRMEEVYANHANKLKDLGNAARKASYETRPTPYSPSAKQAYNKEVQSLSVKLNEALKNKPQERQAQLLANSVVKAKMRAHPDMAPEEVKRLKGLALQEARARTQAKKQSIQITQEEWNAIQAGAITANKLKNILDNTDLALVRQYATPRTNSVMNSPAMARAKSMLAAGYSQADIADALGIPTSTLNEAFAREES